MAKIPMDLDILIMDEIGKNISGAGMDTKVANRGVQGEYNPWPNTPKFQRIFVRNLSEHTYNSAVGLGMADVVTERLVNRINWEPTWINSLTANTPAAIRTPIHFPTDRECLERIAPTVGQLVAGRSDLRLDPQHDGVDADGGERERARRSGEEPATARSRGRSISSSMPRAT